ncbi:NADP dehydrogenase [ubiquinone] 1 beta subcomplex subunit 2, mitochondrial-like protein [Plakobranchus ocellatus]|uniref:NADP dehydrogenase [ubiquinone] 1 beta subcomplex subunit 2, mitochondrial-like protein n=1 Tax=Plakobranchus ocellatus TaxID=259542 RepID=A0AAV4C895_9GAST|nr:NADP dehydrogenase [ubiquinone] 1 beta subcomplex subunit 2, mitochondrial-like protein [Plakobranchus ocellatus]
MSLLIGRLRPLIRSAALLRNQSKSVKKPAIRHAGTITYRAHSVKDTGLAYYLGEGISFFFWYWILYHCWFEFDHLVPPHEYPDPSKFTDEELGIPPDDED